MLDDPTAWAGGNGVGATLSAAAAHGPSGLASDGEERASAVFRSAARPGSVPTQGGPSVMIRIARKIAAAPVAALAAAGMVVAGGGIALAASQGAVHVPFVGHDSRPSDAPSAPATTNPGLTATHAPSDEPTDEATLETPDASPSASPSPSLDGLCVAYQAGAMDKAADNPAFGALQSAAGGADNVDAYCVNLIGASTHPVKPTHPAKPTQAATPSRPVAPPAKPSHRTKPDGVPPTPEKPATAQH